MDRRGFVFGTTLAAAALAAGLSGCTDQTGPTQRDRGSGELPTRVPHQVGEPDLPEIEGGVPAGYFGYPAEPEPRDGFPYQGASAPITPCCRATPRWPPGTGTPGGSRSNSNRGFAFDLNPVQSSEYQAKLQVTLAGGDLPDLVQIVSVPGLPNVLDKFFADLTDHLAGDAIKEFPGLASIPTDAWKIGQVNGRIWGIAAAAAAGRPDLQLPRRPVRGVRHHRAAGAARRSGLPRSLRPGDRSETRPGSRSGPTWPAWILPAMLEMYGAPNEWADGRRQASPTPTRPSR